ncbi:hypothetical protein CLOP_g13696 [Closterium sp. NIES-67]|nr:hypothetical protein CLOP_g13696 [Closterium sp. NIES-67]
MCHAALLRHFTERHESARAHGFLLHTSLPEAPGLPLERQHTTHCLQALAQATRVFLDNAAMLLCKLEAQCRTHGMGLLELKRSIQPIADGVRVLSPVVREVEDNGCGSTEVLDMLHTASTQPDVREAEDLIRFVLHATCAPYLQLLSSWMHEGRLDDDIHSEFLVAACSTTTAAAAGADAPHHAATPSAAGRRSRSPHSITDSDELRLMTHGGAREGEEEEGKGKGQRGRRGQREWRGWEEPGSEPGSEPGQSFVMRHPVPALLQAVADDVVATGQLVHALRQHGWLKQLPSQGEAAQPQMQLGSLEESIAVRTKAVQQAMVDLTLNKNHLMGHLLTIRRVLLLSQADYLSDFMALAAGELSKPAHKASQARIDISLGASLRSSTAATDPNCERLSARLVPMDVPSPSQVARASLSFLTPQRPTPQQQPLQSPFTQSQPVQSQLVVPSQLQQSRESLDGAELLSSLQEYDAGFEDLMQPDADDGHAGGDADGLGDDGNSNPLSLPSTNPLSLPPQSTPARPSASTAVSSWSPVPCATPVLAIEGGGGRGREGRGAAGPSTWEAIYLDYKAPWPISVVVPPASLLAYNRVFRFLLAAKRTHLHLGLAWSALQLSRGLKVEGPLLQRMHWLRHRMACAATAILDHVAHAVVSPSFDLMTARLTKANSFHQLVSEHQLFVDTCLSEGLLGSCPHIQEKLSSILSISLRFATAVSTTIHRVTSLGATEAAAAAGGGGDYGVEDSISGSKLSDYAYGDATSDAKGRAARAAFRWHLAGEELQLAMEEGFAEEIRSMHAAFSSSLRDASAAITSVLRDHPVLLSLHLSLSAVAKGLP